MRNEEAFLRLTPVFTLLHTGGSKRRSNNIEEARFHATPVQTAQTDGTKNQPPYCWAANWIWADGRGGAEGPLRSGSSPGFQTPHPLLGSTEENKDEQALLKEGRSPFLERFFSIPLSLCWPPLKLRRRRMRERKERGEEEAEGIGNIGYWRRREDGRRAQARDRRR